MAEPPEFGERWTETVRQKLSSLPTNPGVYTYRNEAGEEIYVGKAKSLRSRVRSYFQPGAQHSPRVARLVSEIADLEYIVVNTEKEALILESNLIKRLRPRYNVVLRDDKHFPYLKLSLSDRYPRVSLVRQASLDNDVYVGPFLPASTARRSMKLVQRYFQVPTCKETFDGKRRPCLYYHLDQCLAPCAQVPDAETYAGAVADARLFLEGRDKDLENSLKDRMRSSSEAQLYERAARYRDTLRTVQALSDKQQMSSVGLEEQDFLAHYLEGTQVVLQLFQMRRGKIQARREFDLEVEDLELESFYETALVQIYSNLLPPAEVHLPVLPGDKDLLESWLTDRRGKRVRLNQPQQGAKRKFLDLVGKNARIAFENRFRRQHSEGVRALEELGVALGLDEPPFRIECFDISNIQGADSVASMVVWEQGKPRKSEYRSFNIKTVEGPDDFASLAEAVLRRYRRRLAEDRRLPDLVLIDGGVGQLGAAVAALAKVGLPTLPVASLAKREEELFLPDRKESILLDRRSPALQLVQRVRDEAHRFAVSRHRRRRTNRTLRTELTDIRGIGPVTSRKLLTDFGSLTAVRQAGYEAWLRHSGKKIAEALEAHFQPKSSGS